MKNTDINDIKSKLLLYIKSEKIKDALESLNENILNSEEAIYGFFMAISKNVPESEKITILTYLGISFEIEDFIDRATKIFKQNSLAVDFIFSEFLKSIETEISQINNIDIILILGDFFEMIYISGYKFIGKYIRIIYSNLKPKYSFPLIQKLKFKCGKVYFWSDEEAVSLFKILNEFIDECEHKGTNYEKSTVYFYKGLFLKEYFERGLDSVNTYENIYSYKTWFYKSIDLGFKLVDKYVKNFKICTHSLPRISKGDFNSLTEAIEYHSDKDNNYDYLG